MKIFMPDSTFRYDVESLAKAIFKIEELEMTGDLEECGPLLAIFHEKKGDSYDLKIIWKDGRGGILEKRERFVPKSCESRELKKEVRGRLKVLMAKTVLGEESGAILPWGTLTGIKPAKLVHDMMGRGLSEHEIKEKLRSEYLVTEEKMELAMQVAKVEQASIYPPDPKKVSIYIGIPFCPSKCVYCSFPTVVKAGEDFKRAYVDSLGIEMASYAKELEGYEIDTVYIGGGTPTELSAGLLEEVMKIVHGTFDLGAIREFTVEAGRPDTIDAGKLEVMKRYGVDRVSINPQTFNDRTLRLIGRGHNSQAIYETWRMVRPYNFNSVNMDLIVGLPEEGESEMARTMKSVSEIMPDNLTVHTLALKKNAEMRKSPLMKVLPGEKQVRDMISLAESEATRIGLQPYYMYRQKYMLGNMENIGYAKPGKACLYNMHMMNDTQTVIAFGSGVISKFVSLEENRILRAVNYKQVKDYIAAPVEMAGRKIRIKEIIDKTAGQM